MRGYVSVITVLRVLCHLRCRKGSGRSSVTDTFTCHLGCGVVDEYVMACFGPIDKFSVWNVERRVVSYVFPMLFGYVSYHILVLSFPCHELYLSLNGVMFLRSEVKEA